MPIRGGFETQMMAITVEFYRCGLLLPARRFRYPVPSVAQWTASGLSAQSQLHVS